MEKQCGTCGSSFTPRQTTQKFCSKQCYKTHHNRRHWKKVHPPRTEEELTRKCVVCEKSFVTDASHWKALTCSKMCNQLRMNAVRRQARAEERPTHKNCPECGNRFSVATHSAHQLYCSSVCRDRACSRRWRTAHPEYAKTKHNARWAGNWHAALERDGRQCQFCSATSKLNVHHIDGSGETDGQEANHAMENLITLCASCHRDMHQISYRITNGEMQVFGKVFDWLNIDEVTVIHQRGDK